MVTQYRYYGLEENTENSKQNISYNQLIKNVFDNTTIQHITKLGIQGTPGTKFYLNESQYDISNGIIIGNTGIFELDIKNTTEINFLAFDRATLDNIRDTTNPTYKYLIIDIITV